MGWKGNYSAYKYDMTLYNTIGSISFDHPDPCIFTVMTAKSAIEGYIFAYLERLLLTLLSFLLAGFPWIILSSLHTIIEIV